MVILGLDYGEKRIGIAVSDPSGKFSFGLEQMTRSQVEKDCEYIAKITKERNVQKIIVGIPVNMNGSYGFKAEEVKAFCELLRLKVLIPIETWDERLSSVQAERVLLEANVSGRKRRLVLDKLSAQVILQSYLDSRNIED